MSARRRGRPAHGRVAHAARHGLIQPTSRGDPESPLRWTCKSIRRLAAELTRKGHKTSHRMVAELLHELGYSLQANRKVLEGSSNLPDAAGDTMQP